MRREDAIAARRVGPPALSASGAAAAWSDPRYLSAAAFAGLLIAAAPVLWAPPLWITALLAAPARRSGTGRATACV